MPITLTTPQGEALLKDKHIPWQAYPRPQMVRDSYVNLNGSWDFTVSCCDAAPAAYDRKILVPFCPESLLSGVQTHFPEGSFLWYRRKFSLPEGFRKDRVLLHIGAADQHCRVYVNGQEMGAHTGGYESFTLDITPALAEENELVLCCMDDLRDRTLPYGKQTLKRGGMWYTPVSGIWQTVWLESVPEDYIRRLHIENRGYSVTVRTEPALSGTVSVDGLGDFPLENGQVTITPETPRMWSPETPELYRFTLTAAQDCVRSYFAIRSLEIGEHRGYPRLLLNGKPYFFHGLLDQGYWSDGIYTPASADCYAFDILAMKKLGFNTLRKHIKVEPEQFYYDCDRLGMVVFQDMVNNGPYRFFRDTALPTAGLQTLDDRRFHKDPLQRRRFYEGMAATVSQLKNHPCICYWTVFNEGWGQFDADAGYEACKALDDTRFIDTTSGWFRRKRTEVDSRHVYFRPIRLEAKGKPLVLSEFGGYSYKPEGHVFNTEKTYGYGKFAQAADFADAVEMLYRSQVLPACRKGLSAAIYTQVSDVEDETNGLLSYDRKIQKLEAARMQEIARLLQSAGE